MRKPAVKTCSHPMNYWITSIHPDQEYCQLCAQEENAGRFELGDITGDRNNGAGCYDSDTDFS